MPPTPAAATAARQAQLTAASPRVRTRRNWGLIAAGVGLTLLTTVMFAAAWAAGRSTVPVLAMADTVTRGSLIEQSDLTVVHLPSDPALATVPAAEAATLIGRRAALDLAQGSVLTATATTDEPVPGRGRALVGVRLTPGQMPVSEVRPGDLVTVVHAAPDDAAKAIETVAAVVVAAGLGDDGSRVVDVTVPSAQAAQVTAWVAAGKAALYRNSEVR